MRKKQKKWHRERHLSKAGICFEVLEPSLLLPGSWGSVVDGPGAESQADVHGSLTHGSVVFHADAGISGAGNAQVNLAPGSGRVDLLSQVPGLSTFGKVVPSLDASSASIPIALPLMTPQHPTLPIKTMMHRIQTCSPKQWKRS